MFDTRLHRSHLVNILTTIYKNNLLANMLVFKGGTAGYLFYGLPRFSTDLDFDFLFTGVNEKSSHEYVYKKITSLLKDKYDIKDQANKSNTLFWQVSYGVDHMNIKIEVSTRKYTDDKYPDYDTQVFFGESILVTPIGDLIAQKLFTTINRKKVANRDIFDSHFYLTSKYASSINYELLELMYKGSRKDFFSDFLVFLNNYKGNILDGLGEVLEPKQKKWVKNELVNDLKRIVSIYAQN